jgi:hypothetical protein
MMIPERPALERRVLDALDGTATGSGSRIPVVLGGCGTGRSSLLLRLRDLLGRNAAQYVDVERIATTPERFLKSIRESSPFPAQTQPGVNGNDHAARESFAAALTFLANARGSTGGPVTFLLDEFLELRTFESFPGLRSVLKDLLSALGSSGNRFVLSTRYVARAHRLLRDAPSQFEIIHVSALTPAEVAATIASTHETDADAGGRGDLARMVHALSGGRPAYARMIADTAVSMGGHVAADPISALAALLAPGERLSAACRFSYELRLHRARGYGALKAILDVLAQEEPLTLTEIASRLHRTPGSTKDYLSWLEDVDLVISRQKRYSFGDPLLRLWVRLNGRPVPPSEEEIAREVHTYVLSNLPPAEPALALAGEGAPAAAEKNWGIIEID